MKKRTKMETRYYFFSRDPAFGAVQRINPLRAQMRFEGGLTGVLRGLAGQYDCAGKEEGDNIFIKSSPPLSKRDIALIETVFPHGELYDAQGYNELAALEIQVRVGSH